MTIAYTKTINSLPSYKEIDGNSDVVFSISWNLSGKEGAFSSGTSLNTQVPYVAGQPFTPYADLTQEQVLGWIDQYTPEVQMTEAEETIAKNIAQKQTVVIPPLPWPVPPPV